MIEIEASNLSKKFNNYYILKNFNYIFESGSSYAIQGGNGTGKSTLVKMLCGFLSPSAGKVTYKKNDDAISRNAIYAHVALAAPYSTIIQDFSLRENFDFMAKFKSLPQGLDYNGLIELLEWKDTKTKTISQFSSGMQQKVNVCFAFIAGTPLLFLDEPTSYMDTDARAWYKKMFDAYTHGRTTIVASNDTYDFGSDAKIIQLGK
jgi:ABC-type multidrug transport system ATPase subunit